MAVVPVAVVVSSSSTVVGIVVTVRVVMISVVAVVVRGSDCHLEVVPSHISENTVLDVTSQQTLLGEGVAILLGVDSPSHVSSEEKWTIVSDSDVLVQIVFEQLLGFSRCHYYYFTFINYKSKF